MKWFKFYGQDFQTDTKIGFLNPLQKLMWINLLCIASQDEEHSGILEFVSEEHLKAISGITDNQFNDDWDRTTGTLKLFEEMGLIEKRGKNAIIIKNFKEKQDTNLTDAERSKRYREKQKIVTKVTQSSQDSHTRIDKNRIDKNTKYIATKVADSPKTPKTDSPMTLKEFVDWTSKSPQRHIQIIGDWADTTQPAFSTKDQWTVFIKRNLRAAKDLVPFSQEQLVAAYSDIQKANSDGWLKKATLETLIKFLK